MGSSLGMKKVTDSPFQLCVCSHSDFIKTHISCSFIGPGHISTIKKAHPSLEKEAFDIMARFNS